MSSKTHPKHAKAHAYAVHCIGVHESPARSNRGPLQKHNPNGGVDFFQEHDFVDGHGYPWCASFFLTCWDEAGHKLPYGSPSAHQLGDWARRAGWAKGVNDLIPGDGCDWSEGSGHFSMFERFDHATGLVHTIDGNWGDQVQRATHRVGLLRTGVHIPEGAVPPPAPHPYWTVATSVNGHRKLLFSKRATQKRVLGLVPRWLKNHGGGGVTIRRSKRKPAKP